MDKIKYRARTREGYVYSFTGTPQIDPAEGDLSGKDRLGWFFSFCNSTDKEPERYTGQTDEDGLMAFENDLVICHPLNFGETVARIEWVGDRWVIRNIKTNIRDTGEYITRGFTEDLNQQNFRIVIAETEDQEA